VNPEPSSDLPRPPEPVARPAGLVSLATMCSRVMGLIREAVFAALFATGGVADAYVFAFRIPNLLRDFFAEGALASAFVPTFAKTRAQEGEAAASHLARRVFGTLGAMALLLVVLGIIFAPAIVDVVAMKASGDVKALTVRLTRIMFPFLFFVAMASVAMGILNTNRRYFLPALAPVFFNVVAVLGGVYLLLAGLDIVTAITVWSVLVVVGGALQFLVQVPGVRAVGVRGTPEVDWRFRDPGIRTIARRMGPVVLSLMATNVMLVIMTILASQEKGWASSLNFAFRLVHLPIGVVGVAIGTVILAAGSRHSAEDDHAGVDDVVKRGLRLNWFLALPAAVGLFVLAEPIVRLVYERGAFEDTNTLAVASALRWYAGGVVFYAGVKAAAPDFLARGDTRTPMLCALVGIAVNLVVAFSLVGPLGFRALALAVAAGAAANYILLRILSRIRHGTGSAAGVSFLLRTLLASAVLGAAGWAAGALWLDGDAAVSSRWGQALLTLATIGALGALYFLVAAGLGLDEGAWVRRRVLRRQAR
jgi:putative peptidoglycan lipid II flippase